jgi:transcriptional regulator with XRE-family HTH domain
MSILRVLRQKKGISLSKLSHSLGVHYTHLCQVELGNMRIAEKWHQPWAEALGVPVGDVFDERGFAREVEDE